MKHILAYSPNVEYSQEELSLESLLFRCGKLVRLASDQLNELNRAGANFSEKATFLRHEKYVLAHEGENLAIFEI